MKALSAVMISLIMVILFTGCASAPTEEEIRNANYGKPVSIGTCMNIAKTFISNQMKDPSTTQFRGVQCQRGWSGNVPIAGVKAQFGYHFIGEINAKNSFGGYAGFTPFQGIVKDTGNGPRVIMYCITDNTSEYGLCFPHMVR